MLDCSKFPDLFTLQEIYEILSHYASEYKNLTEANQYLQEPSNSGCLELVNDLE